MEAVTLWKIRGAVMAGIFGTLFVFLGAGALVDAWRGSSPIGLITGLILSFPVSNMIGIRLAKRYATSSPSR